MTIETEAIWRQARIVSIVSLGFFMTGANYGWLTRAIEELLLPIPGENDGTTIQQAFSLIFYRNFGHFLIPIPVGMAADIIGRRPIFIFQGALTLLGWTTIAFTANFNWLRMGQFMMGLTSGIQVTLAHIYLSEVCSKHLRGRFSSMAYIFENVGFLFQFILGACFPTSVLSKIALLISLTYTCVTFFIVESPYYLLSRRRDDQAKRNFSWLHGTADVGVSDEFATMATSVRTYKNFCQTFGNLLSRNNRKGFAVVLMLSFLDFMTGGEIVSTYGQMSLITAHRGSLLVGVSTHTLLLVIVIVIVSIVPAVLSDVTGRRMMLIATGASCIFSHLLMGGIYVLRDNANINHYWPLFISLSIYSCCSSISTSNVLTLRGELLGVNSRGLGSGFAVTVFAASSYIVSSMISTLIGVFGIYYALWALCGTGLVYTVLTKAFVPETKNKTLPEIQGDLSKTASSTNESELRNVNRVRASFE